MDTAESLITRAVSCLSTATFGTLKRVTALEYARIASRTQAAREAAGGAWAGIDALGGAPATRASRRAAWARRTHQEVARALDDLRSRRAPVAQCLARLGSWVPEAEACPPCPEHVPTPTGERKPVRNGSKRYGLSSLPQDWLDQLWTAAATRGYRHLDALAVLLVTGCRPAEVCRGHDPACVTTAEDGWLHVRLDGAKVTGNQGQPWRVLQVAVDGPAAEHLHALGQAGRGRAHVQAACTPAALSMAIADLGEAAGLPHRVSAYDARHQRAADARAAFGGNPQMLAAWLGHSVTSTARHYGDRERTAGSTRGPCPLDAQGSRWSTPGMLIIYPRII